MDERINIEACKHTLIVLKAEETNGICRKDIDFVIETVEKMEAKIKKLQKSTPEEKIREMFEKEYPTADHKRDDSGEYVDMYTYRFFQVFKKGFSY